MEDCYQVEVLHFLNPYLIWVGVKSSDSSIEFVYEQVGIYGVLPLETTIDIIDVSLKTQRSNEWMPAAATLLLKEFGSAKEVRFIPTHLEERTSIFDENIHKFGEFIILKRDGQQKKLSKLLVENNLALFDVCTFHEELSNGLLDTKLSRIQTKEVITQIEKSISKVDKQGERAKSVKKHTIVLQTAQEIESALTTINIQKHNLKHETELILNKKLKDLELCKSVDEESVGRAVRNIKMSKTPEIATNIQVKKGSQYLLKKLISYRSCDLNSSNSAEMLAATKAYLDDHAINNINDEINVSPSKSQLNPQPFHFEHSIDEIKDLEYKNTTPKSNDGKVSTKKHSAKTSKKSPEVRAKKTVAYGPPGLDKKVLPVKTVSSIIEYESELDLVPTKIEISREEEEVPKNCSAFGNLDSEVNFEISNCKTLFEPNIKFTTKSNDVNNKVEILQTQPIDRDDQIDSKLNIVVKNPPACDHEIKLKNKSESSSCDSSKIKSGILRKKCKMSKENNNDISFSSSSDTNSGVNLEKTKTIKNQIDEIELEEIDKKLRLQYNPINIITKKEESPEETSKILKNFTNPFKNVDPNLSVFVDNLLLPILMVHTKTDKRIMPRHELRDIPFNTHIQVVLKNMNVEHPMMLQTVSWFTILRGHSVFLISPMNSGKTLGYIPAVCRLVTDSNVKSTTSVGPTAIIVCATSQSVAHIERLSKMFLNLHKKVFACYAGMDEFRITTALLNGCDMLICTPSILVRLLQMTDFGVDLHRLTTFVLDDCERLSVVYRDEIKFFLLKIKEMLKNRVHKELNVQYILASRVWCDFMEPLAKKEANTVICVGAFQECVLYSRAATTVKFVKHEKKVQETLEFLKEIDISKKTIIVCRKDDEVALLEKDLIKMNHLVLACNNTMTVQELYNMSKAWRDYQDSSHGPILLCCDSNLMYLNVTDAHSLLHFSLPSLFSSFCKRFSVLNDHYSSIFKLEKEMVRIKILLDDTNIEQLPKILNFIKRCTSEVPECLETVCEKVLAEKDVVKAQNYVPLCNNLLAFGECPDFWNCLDRHSVLKKYDEPKSWMPKGGYVTFKILHYHTAVLYSVRLLTNVETGETTKYPQTYSNLSIKMGIYFSKESNKRPLGIPKVGDVCAVSAQQNFYVRCQVIKILNQYNNGNPNYVRIKMLDEEKYEISRDIYLYYLPVELKKIETYVVQVRLANIQPKDKDTTFSELALSHLKKITDNDEELYLRGKVINSVGNCVFVDTLEACQTLSSFNEVVVKYDFRKELLDAHAIVNFEHLSKLQSLCKKLNLETADVEPKEQNDFKEPTFRLIPRWAHLDCDDVSSVFFASAVTPSKFFIRLAKFEDCMNSLIKDIKKYSEENPEPVKNVCVGDIVLAKFPDDQVFERAKIDELLCQNVKCFFVDQGDWRDVHIKDVIPISEKLIKQMPFQAIECRLIGIKPAGNDWTDFSTNWLCDHCYEENHKFLKNLYVKYFTKEQAECTNGFKYGVALIDTTGADDVIINQIMIDVNIAQENFEEIHFLTNEGLKRHLKESDGLIDENEWEKISNNNINEMALAPTSSANLIFKQPIRSMPLVPSDDEMSDTFAKWDINMGGDFVKLLNPLAQSSTQVPPKVNVTDDKVHYNKIKLIDDQPDCSKDTSVPEKKISLQTFLETKRKPKVLWKQTQESISVKILLICDHYTLNIGQRSLDFSANVNDIGYGFEFELYGVLNVSKCLHSNKGQYILVKMTKLMPREWLTLTKDECLKKWIVYDVDSIDISSDEEEVTKDHLENIVKTMHNKEDSDSDADFIMT